MNNLQILSPKFILSKLKSVKDGRVLNWINLPVTNYYSLLYCDRWSSCGRWRILNFQQCYWKILNVLLADIAGIIAFDAKPFHCTFFMGKSKLSFATALHLQRFTAFSKFDKTDSTDCLFFWNVFCRFIMNCGDLKKMYEIISPSSRRENELIDLYLFPEISPLMHCHPT